MQTDTTGSRNFWLFLLALVPLYMTWTFDHSLWNPDETRDGGIASEMYRKGDYVVPRLNGQPFLEKPPLYYWATAILYKITGRITAGTTRLPAVLFGILGVVFTFLIGQRLFNERVGLFAAAILATSAQYFRMSHVALMDVALAALTTGALYCYLKGSTAGYALLTVLAFLAKGFLGVILSGLVVTIDCLIGRKPRQLIKIIGVGVLFFAALGGPWLWALWKEGGLGYLEVFLVDNHWKRFFSEAADHTEHFWFFYFLSFPVDFLPWTIFFAGFLWDVVKDPLKYSQSPQRKFLMIWFFSLLAFFCLSSSKRSIYLLPLFPAAAILCAAWLDEAIAKKSNEKAWERRIYASFAGLAAFVGLASFYWAPLLDKKKSFVPFCEVVSARRGDGALKAYDMSEMEMGVFGFYLNGPIENLIKTQDLQDTLAEMRSKPFCLIANRNKMEEIAPVIGNHMQLIHEFRPDQRTRSYLLYENTHR